MQKKSGETGSKATVAESVYDRIRWDIILGILPPGKVLKSDWMRGQYSVGISPLREALTRLSSERLIVAESQRGFRVAPLDEDEVQDVLNTRILIETQALRDAIATGDVAWEGRILAAYHVLSRTPIPQPGETGSFDWIEAHKDFHMQLLSASSSRWLKYLAGLLFDQSERYRAFRTAHSAEAALTRDVSQEHERILSACLAREAEEACDALEAHYRSTSQAVISDLHEGKAPEM
ncbi:GntR family transcriptional regulator [Salipiger abyssi]|uniref:GntR family transcriptional regulator n=1 Tax=Salipiger abyssi TaxID=1250539 RepID=UPI001A8E18A7|nr:FCD domain-containing protein [Salipiger abyssi]MBN9888129.1 FCD domain-containing protein [Salipiger abyssi]